MISFQGGVSGMNLASITDPANYSFVRKVEMPRGYVITSVTLVPPASSSGPVLVALTSSAGRPLPAGHYLFAILSGGITDNAGNKLDGTYVGGFPTGGSPGSMFKVGFFSKNQYPSKPASSVHFVPVVTKHAKVVVAS